MVTRAKGRNAFFAPRFFIEIEGIPTPDVLQNAVSFTYTDNAKKADEMILVLNNSSLRFQNDFRFATGNRLKVRWGYPNEVSNTRQLVIVEVSTTLAATIPVITIKANDLRRTMHKSCAPYNYGSIASSDVAAQVARRYGLRTEITPSKDARKESRIQPADTTDIAFLMGLAEKLHWDCYIEGGVLHFKPKSLGSRPAFVFDYFTDGSGTLISFSSKLDLRKVPKVGATGVDNKTGGTTSQESSPAATDDLSMGLMSIDADYGSYEQVGSPQPRLDGSGGSIGAAMRAPSGNQGLLCPSPETDPNLVKAHANARQARIELNAVEADVTVIGTPLLTARQVIRLRGVGKAYSGNWRVEQSVHKIQSAGEIYTTVLKLKRNALNVGKTEDKVPTNKSNDQNDAGLKQQNNVVEIETDVGATRRRYSP